MTIRNDNYVTLLGWMRTELDLTGSELIIYALVYMVSQTDSQDYYATQEYAAEWAGVSIRSVRNNLNSLLEKGLIEKVTRCIDGKFIATYRVTNYHNPDRKKLPAEKSGMQRKKLPTYIKRDIKEDIENISLYKSKEDIDSTKDIDSNKDNVNTNKDKIKKFIPPTVEEVAEYCRERKNGINAESFVDFYESKGWLIGKNKMKDWKAAVRTWERNNYSSKEKGKIYDSVDDDDIVIVRAW